MWLSEQYKDHYVKNLSLAGPIMLGQIGQLTVNIIDNLMVGRLGAIPLAAISFSISIYISLFVAGMGLSFVLPALIAEANGNKTFRKISQYFKHSLVINITYALLCVLIIELVIPYVDLFGQDPEVVKVAIPYLRISAWTMIPMMFFQTLRCYTDGMSQTKLAMYAILMGNVFNVIFNYILIFGKFGAPAMGVTGAAFGTLIARSLMIVFIIAFIYRRRELWQYLSKVRYRVYQRTIIKKILRLGIPTGLQMFFEVSAFGGAAIIMGTIGAKQLAAHQIAINLASITFLICTGLGMAATIRVGNYLGRDDIKGVRSAGFSAIIQSIVFMILGAIIFIVFRWQLPHIYLDDLEVIKIAASLLLLAAVFQVSDGVQVAALGVLRGLQDVRIPMFITFISYWIIGLPTSIATVHYLDWGPEGVWVGLVLGLTVSAVMLSYRFHLKSRIT